jgi:hypothetical protein
LAFPNVAIFSASPFFQTLATQGALPTNSFGMYLAQNDSELYLGGTNDRLHKGNFTYAPLTQVVRLCRVDPRFDDNNHALQGYWETNFDALYLNGRKISGVRDAVIDSGTTQIVGDRETVQTFYDRIPGSADIGSGVYSGTYIRQLSLGHRETNSRFLPVPCSFNATLSVQFGGANFAIDPQIFNLGPVSENSTNCIGGLSSADANREHIVSSSLLCLINDSLLDYRRCLPAKHIHEVRRQQ